MSVIETARYYGESAFPPFPPRLSLHTTARAGTQTPGPDMASGPPRTEPRSPRLPQRAPGALLPRSNRPTRGRARVAAQRLSVAAAGSLADFTHQMEVCLVGPLHH